MEKIYTEKRPWGEFSQFALNEPVTVKIITVLPHQAFSLQTHKKRDEFWHIISGSGFITIGEERKALLVGENYTVAKETKHQIEAGDESVIFLEIARGDFDENDIVRIKDLYGRA
jgi:mannose-6-phosphate isomerase-like protein (cupin superfamily)